MKTIIIKTLNIYEKKESLLDVLNTLFSRKKTFILQTKYYFCNSKNFELTCTEVILAEN